MTIGNVLTLLLRLLLVYSIIAVASGTIALFVISLIERPNHTILFVVGGVCGVVVSLTSQRAKRVATRCFERPSFFHHHPA